MQLFDKSGKPVEVPDDQVGQAFATGDYGLPAGQEVPVNVGGQVGTVPSESLHEALQQGAQIASPEELEKAQAEEEYGGLGGMAESALAGGARGLTAGLSDVALAGIAGDKTRKTLEALKEVNPITSAVSEGIGAVAPLRATGGGSAAVEGAEAAGALARASEAGGAALRGAGSVSRGVQGLGELAGEGATKLLGDNVLGRIAGEAANASVQGGLTSVGDQLSEDALDGNPDVNGEKLLAALGHGMLLGAAGGGLLGATGEIGREVLGRASPHLGGLAETQAWRTISGRKAFQTEAERIPGGDKAIGRMLLDDGLVSAGDTVESIAPKINEARKDAGTKIGDLLDSADKAGVEGPSLAEIRLDVRRRVLDDLSKMGRSNAGATAKVEDLMHDLPDYVRQVRGLSEDTNLAGAQLTFKEAQGFRRMLDDRIRWSTSPLAPVNETVEALKGVRDVIEQSIVDAGEKGASKLGGAWKKTYEEAKLKYRRLLVADKAAQDTVQRYGANASLSLTDKLMTSGGLNAGLLHGMLGGHGLAGLAAGGLHGAALGAISGAISKTLRTRGNSTAAVLLDKLSSLGGIQAAARKVNAQVDRGLGGFFRGGSRGEIARKVAGESYEQKVKQVAEAVGAADAHADSVARAAATVGAHAPKTANSFERTALKITAFLASKIPSGHQAVTSLTPQLDKPRVSSLEKAQFERAYAVAHDPVGTVVSELQRGTLTRDEVDALRTMYPQLYEELTMKVRGHLSALKKPLSSSKESQLRVLLGMPSQDRALFQTLQSSFSPPAPPMNGPPKGGHVSGMPKRMVKGLAQSTGLIGSGKSSM